jgi:hypothetical protein
MTHLTSSDTCLIKATRIALENIKANEELIQNLKTGKVTAVVTIMKIFDTNVVNSRNSNSRKLSIKSNKQLNLKKKHLTSAKLHQIGLNEPTKDVSKRLIVKKKTIRVLLDTGSNGDLLFIRKGSQKYIPCTKWAAPQSLDTSNGTFLTKKVGEIDDSFVEYSISKSVHPTHDIMECDPGANAHLYDLIIGKQCMT